MSTWRWRGCTARLLGFIALRDGGIEHGLQRRALVLAALAVALALVTPAQQAMARVSQPLEPPAAGRCLLRLRREGKARAQRMVSISERKPAVTTSSVTRRRAACDDDTTAQRQATLTTQQAHCRAAWTHSLDGAVHDLCELLGDVAHALDEVAPELLHRQHIVVHDLRGTGTWGRGARGGRFHSE